MAAPLARVRIGPFAMACAMLWLAHPLPTHGQVTATETSVGAGKAVESTPIWPKLRGDLHNTGRSPYVGPEGPHDWGHVELLDDT